jgi:hypothetical protein
VEAFSAASPSLIAGQQVHLAATSNEPQAQAAPRDNSLAAVRVPSTQPAAGLQDPAARAHRVDAPDLARALDSALRVLVDLGVRDLVQAALRPPGRHRVHSVHRRIARVAADSSIRRRRKAQ